MQTNNPLNHPFPHAKLGKGALTSIKRLRRPPKWRLQMVGNRSLNERNIYDDMMREQRLVKNRSG